MLSISLSDALKDIIKYKDFIKDSKACKTFSGCGGSYLLRSLDSDALAILAGLIIAKIARIEDNEALSANADIILLPALKQNIGTADIEFLIENSILTPFKLNHRFYILRDAQNMTEAAQNKLLKTLEEPPESACIILLSSGEGLLPTIISRCTVINLEPFTQIQIENELKKHYPYDNALKLATASSRGLIGIADKIIKDKNTMQDFTSALSVLSGLQGQKDIIVYSALLENSAQRLKQIIDFIELILRDVMVCENPELMNFAHEQRMGQLVFMYPQKCIPSIIAHIGHANKRIKNNGNILSVIDELLFLILEERLRCQR